MWLVIKTKHNCNIKLLKQNLINLLNKDLKFFAPKMKIIKLKSNKFFYKDFFVLGSYIILYHSELKKKIIVNKINLLKENELIQLSKIFQVLSDIEIFQILTKKKKSNSLYKEIFNKLLNE